MICKRCMKNVATVKFTEVVDGNTMQHHLCRPCYEEYQRDAKGFSVEVPKPRQGTPRRRSLRARAEDASRCDACGTSLSRICETAEVGCASCYGTYGKEVESLLEALHRGLAHRGKSFACDDARARLAMELQTKRLLLRSVLKAEKYEEAARLRDEIAALEDAARNAETPLSAEG